MRPSALQATSDKSNISKLQHNVHGVHLDTSRWAVPRLLLPLTCSSVLFPVLGSSSHFQLLVEYQSPPSSVLGVTPRSTTSPPPSLPCSLTGTSPFPPGSSSLYKGSPQTSAKSLQPPPWSSPPLWCLIDNTKRDSSPDCCCSHHANINGALPPTSPHPSTGSWWRADGAASVAQPLQKSPFGARAVVFILDFYSPEHNEVLVQLGAACWRQTARQSPSQNQRFETWEDGDGCRHAQHWDSITSFSKA